MTKVDPNPRRAWVSLVLSAVIGPPVLAVTSSLLAVLAGRVLQMSIVVSFLLPLLAATLIAFLVAGFRRTHTLAAEVIFLVLAGIMSILAFGSVWLLAALLLGGGLY